MSFKFEDKLLSTLAKYEILKLPGMSQYKDLPVKELKVKLNEICKTRGLKRGSKIKHHISKRASCNYVTSRPLSNFKIFSLQVLLKNIFYEFYLKFVYSFS